MLEWSNAKKKKNVRSSKYSNFEMRKMCKRKMQQTDNNNNNKMLCSNALRKVQTDCKDVRKVRECLGRVAIGLGVDKPAVVVVLAVLARQKRLHTVEPETAFGLIHDLDDP